MSDLFIAMLALSEPSEPNANTIVEAFARLVPNASSRLQHVDPPAGSGTPESAHLFQVGDTLLSVIPVDQPLPPGTLDDAIEADRVWPEAKEKLAAHKAHIIVGAVTEATDHASAINTASLVTAVAAAITSITPTIGIYWSNGNTITERSTFLTAAQGLFAGQPPATVWVQMLWLDGPPTPKGERTLAVVTTGLRPFVGREIEFLPVALPPRTIAERVIGAIVYLLSNGPVLKDGDTLGVSEQERIRVVFANSGQRPGVPVMNLSLERLESSATVQG